MLSRFIAKSSNLRFIALVSSRNSLHKSRSLDPPISNPNPFVFSKIPHFYSTSSNNDGKGSSTTPASHLWNISSETDESNDSIFDEEGGFLAEEQRQMKSESRTQKWESESLNAPDGGVEDIFREVNKVGNVGNDMWATADGYKPWTLEGNDDDKEELDGLFDVGEGLPGQEYNLELEKQGSEVADLTADKTEEEKKLEVEEKGLNEVLKGPNRAFGDLIAASGITDEMLDSLIALRDFDGIEGLPPLWKIEDNRYEKNTRKSLKGEIELQKQEEVAKARVQQIDDKGRAYGTGRRKCSIARVWVQPGDGKFVVNDKEFDVYFPMLDHRAILLRPFSETKTLGLWDVNCTVKGGGVSGQVGAIRLGISRALQNWAPDLRPTLRAAGFLTRDSRVVERKKPGKAKARKSFQWVKR